MPFNRTIVELKHSLLLSNYNRMASAFNRTIVELKLA